MRILLSSLATRHSPLATFLSPKKIPLDRRGPSRGVLRGAERYYSVETVFLTYAFIASVAAETEVFTPLSYNERMSLKNLTPISEAVLASDIIMSLAF